MNRISRRRFLEDSAALLAATAAVPGAALAARPAPAARRAGPNDRIRVAVVGVRGRGMSHVHAFAAMPDVEVAAICDADTAAIGPAVKAVEQRAKTTPRTVQDLRRLLEDKDIDVISTATPNHWHALVSVWAMQAGKDVYVEKPASHQVLEGRRMVEAARKYGRICQVGTQSRASKGIQEAMAYLHEGKLGKVHLARGLCYKRRPSIGQSDGPQPVPPTVDYDLWLGPAPQEPPRRRQFHYDWHWFWDYGNGDLGNQGVHEMDKARWGLNKSTLPRTAIGLGGRFGYVDDGETPNTEVVVLDYGDSQLIFEVRGLPTPDLNGARVGNIFYGSEGVMVMPSYSSATVFDLSGDKVQHFEGDGDHFRNFIEAVRSRRPADLFCPIEEGHLSAALCHLGNVSLLLGKEEPLRSRPGAIGDDREAYETFGRFEDHLAANGINLDAGTYRLGRRLRLDTRSERAIGDGEANRLFTREYRKPFVLPDRV